MIVEVSITVRNIMAENYGEAKEKAFEHLTASPGDVFDALFSVLHALNVYSLSDFKAKAVAYRNPDNTFTVVIP